MGSRSRKNKDTEVTPTETNPATEPSEEKVIPDLRSLFVACDATEEVVAAAKANLETAKDTRSLAIKAISENHGNGPFDYDGRRVSITTRTEVIEGDDGDKSEKQRYFFKRIKQTVQVV